jgi:hypothetical protein
MKKIPFLLVLALAACNGSQNGSDGGTDGGDGGVPVFGECPFPLRGTSLICTAARH